MKAAGRPPSLANPTNPMELKIEIDGGQHTVTPRTTMVGDTIEIYDKEASFWSGLTLTVEEQKDLLNTLWWNLHHQGELRPRPPTQP